MAEEWIDVRGARENNLANVSVRIPRSSFVVVTGPSGSGKSSLIFDTIYREARVRFGEVLRVSQKSFADIRGAQVDSVTGLGFASAVLPHVRHVHFSTLASVTEVYHCLRLLFFHAGTPHCLSCGNALRSLTRRDLLDELQRVPEGSDVLITAPFGQIAGSDVGRFVLELSGQGFSRARLNGSDIRLTDQLELKAEEEFDFSLLIDRFAMTPKSEARLLEAVDLAENHGVGEVSIEVRVDSEESPRIFSLTDDLRCSSCGVRQSRLTQHGFSYYRYSGMCRACEGRGVLDDECCRVCSGSRLREEAMAYRLCGRSFAEVLCDSVTAAGKWADELAHNDEYAAENLEGVVAELRTRLKFLLQLGLGYLQLNRGANSLSAGELQRCHLASGLSCGVQGTLYLFDEPTHGLHPNDTAELTLVLRELVEAGNSVVAIEHDGAVIRQADYLIEMGPGAGEKGGRVVAADTGETVLAGNTETATWLRGSDQIDIESSQNTAVCKQAHLTLRGVALHNLQNVSVDFPLQCITAVTGVSGSGKSSLLLGALAPAMRLLLRNRKEQNAEESLELERFNVAGIEGWESITSVFDSSGAPASKNYRSTVATITGVLKPLRELFALTTEAKIRGLTAQHFSYNLAAGRCAACEGAGFEDLATGFMSESMGVCRACSGSRYKPEIEQIRLRGYSIVQLFSLTVAEVTAVFTAIPDIAMPLEVLQQFGLDYLKLGQVSDTLSRGERQRLTLASKLSQSQRGNTLFIFDEPTQGLHGREVSLLENAFRRLIESGNTVVFAEHNLQLIRAADYLVDLGSNAGSSGGRIAACGTPNELKRSGGASVSSYL